MTSKLSFRSGEVSLEIEGEPAFIKEVLESIRPELATALSPGGRKAAPKPPAGDLAAVAEEGRDDDPEADAEAARGAGTPRRPRRRRTASTATANGGDAKAEAFKVALERGLQTPGLREEYAKWKPKNHSEKVLIFANYLKEQGHAPCTANQINTCYFTLRLERPKAFIQAIRDAHSKHGLVDYKSPADVTVTALGEDYMWHHLQKADAE